MNEVQTTACCTSVVGSLCNTHLRKVTKVTIFGVTTNCCECTKKNTNQQSINNCSHRQTSEHVPTVHDKCPVRGCKAASTDGGCIAYRRRFGMPIRSKSHVRRLDRRRDAVESWFVDVERMRWRRVAVWRLGGSCSAVSLGASISERDDVCV